MNNVTAANNEQNENGEPPQQIVAQLNDPNANIDGEFRNNTTLDSLFQKLIEYILDDKINFEKKIPEFSMLNCFLEAHPNYLEKIYSLGVTGRLFNEISENPTHQVIEYFIKLLDTICKISPNKEACCTEKVAALMYFMTRLKGNLDVLRLICTEVVILCKGNTNEMQRSSLLTILDTCLLNGDDLLRKYALDGLEWLTYIDGYGHYVSDIIDSGIWRRVIDIIDRDYSMITNEDVSLIVISLCARKRGCQILLVRNILPKISLMFTSSIKHVRERGVHILRQMTLYFTKVGIESIRELGYMKHVWDNSTITTNRNLLTDCIFVIYLFIKAADFNGRIELVTEGRQKHIAKLIQDVEVGYFSVQRLNKSLELLNEAAEESVKS